MNVYMFSDIYAYKFMCLVYVSIFVNASLVLVCVCVMLVILFYGVSTFFGSFNVEFSHFEKSF